MSQIKYVQLNEELIVRECKEQGFSYRKISLPKEYWIDTKSGNHIRIYFVERDGREFPVEIQFVETGKECFLEGWTRLASIHLWADTIFLHVFIKEKTNV